MPQAFRKDFWNGRLLPRDVIARRGICCCNFVSRNGWTCHWSSTFSSPMNPLYWFSYKKDLGEISRCQPQQEYSMAKNVQFSDQKLPCTTWLINNNNNCFKFLLPTVLWHCWLGIRKSIRTVKFKRWDAGVVYVWSKVQMICIWSSWCHYHPIVNCFIKIYRSYG